MRLQKIHLFIIILLVIIASSFGFVVREYMQNREVVTLGDDGLDREKESESIWNRRRGGGGIPRSEIPEGDEDLYILKSQVVPPVCPKCPDSRTCPRPKPPPPCPPCARCPEPAFTCKKVPNYNAISASRANGILPLPQLNSFAAFN